MFSSSPPFLEITPLPTSYLFLQIPNALLTSLPSTLFIRPSLLPLSLSIYLTYQSSSARFGYRTASLSSYLRASEPPACPHYNNHIFDAF